MMALETEFEISSCKDNNCNNDFKNNYKESLEDNESSEKCNDSGVYNSWFY